MSEEKRYVPPSREGRGNLTVWLPRERIQEIKRLAVDTRIPMQDLVNEGLDYILEKYRTFD
jgi:hypothetical protein